MTNGTAQSVSVYSMYIRLRGKRLAGTPSSPDTQNWANRKSVRSEALIGIRQRNAQGHYDGNRFAHTILHE